MTASTAPARADETRRLLRWVALVAIVDLLLFVPLLVAALTDAESVVSVLGPLHGIGFLLELFLVVKGAGEGLWGWWLPPLVIVTTGPPGALVGHMKITRELGRAAGEPAPAATSA